jgi:hypothetical protein
MLNNMKTNYKNSKIPKKLMVLLFVAWGLVFPRSLMGQIWTSRYELVNNSYAGYQPLSAFVPGNGYMQTPRSISPYSYYWTIHENYTSICTGSNYALEVRLRCAAPEGIDAYDTGVGIEGSCGSTWCNLMGASWAQSFTYCNITHQSQPSLSTSNQAALVRNLSTYGILRIEINTTNVVYRFNGTQIWSFPFSGGIGEQINKLTIRFKGSGSVDYVRIYNGAGNLIFDEGFEDTVFPSASPCSFPLSGCPAPLATDGIGLFVDGQSEVGFQLSWQAEKSNRVLGYDILRSENGNDFAVIAQVPRLEQFPVQSFTDTTCLGSVFYQVRSRMQDGSVEYSSIVQGRQQVGTTIGWRYADGMLQLRLNGACTEAGDVVRLRICDPGGHTLWQADHVNISDGKAVIPIELPAGLYVLMIWKPDGAVSATKMIVY